MISTDNSVQKLRNQKLNKTKYNFLDQIRLVGSHLLRFTHFLGITFPSFDSNSNIFATAAESLEHICFSLKIFISIKQAGYQYNRLAIDRTGWLSIEQVGYRWISLTSLAIVGYC